VGLDSKYGRVSFENGDIKEDEPVFVFRAQDALMVPMLNSYWFMCHQVGSPQEHLDKILETIKEIKDWQEENTIKVPTSETSEVNPWQAQ